LTSGAQPHARPTGTPAAAQADGSRSSASGRHGSDGGRAVPVSDLVISDSSRIEVIHHPSERFYELLDDGISVALLVYEQSPQQTTITHATVREDRRGHGLGTTLIATAVPDLVSPGRKIANYCDSVARFLDKHPDYEKFVHPER